MIVDTTEIQGIITDYFEQLYVNRLENLEEMDKFIDTYNLPRLKHEEIQNLNRPITSNEIKTHNKKSPAKKIMGPNDFTAELHEIFKFKELMLMLLKLF